MLKFRKVNTLKREVIKSLKNVQNIIKHFEKVV